VSDALVKFIKLRYRLLPYIYSLAGMETQQDYTMMRALAFDFRRDPQVYNISDQFMLGPALMVCPVTEPMYYEAGSKEIIGKPRQRQVYLPAGCDWYDFWTCRRYAGGQVITAEASLDIIPLFVCAGSILPLGPAIQYAGEQAEEPLELWVYPGAEGRFALYEDEGDGYAYEKGEFAWTPITWDEARRTLTVGPREGHYAGMPAIQKIKAILATSGAQVGVTQETLETWAG
jgi:alpha-D-xyloside xylohydrolase